MKTTRYIGDAVVTISYFGWTPAGDEYRGTVWTPKGSWDFDRLYAAPAGFGPGVAYDSPKAYDAMARTAVSFGSYYTTHNRSQDVPDWAPPADIADAIADATAHAFNAKGTELVVTRSRRTRARG